MSPIDWAKRPLQRYADFKGRAPRAEYWWYALAVIIAEVVAMLIDSVIGIQLIGPYGLLLSLLVLALIVPGLAVTIRRLHDTNRSGWWILIAVVPYAIFGFMAARSGMMTAEPGQVPDMGTAAGVGMASIIVLIGAIVLLVFMILPGTKGPNKYGPDPYGEDVEKVFA